MNAWEESACYPRGSFYPISDGNPILITAGSLSPTFVPAPHVRVAVKLPSAFILFKMVSNHLEGTFGRLCYSFGGDRPSQTAQLALSAAWITAQR